MVKEKTAKPSRPPSGADGCGLNGPTKTPKAASAPAPVSEWPKEIDISKLEFVGCEAVPMTREQYLNFQGRLEVWDAELETAWIVRDSLMPAPEGSAKRFGRAEGRAEGHAEAVASMVAQMLRSRGIGTSTDFPANAPGFAEASEAALVEAALACADEVDFRARVATLGKA